MKLKNIQWRNIKSYGNKLQRIDFDDNGGLWMVLGKNGNGKSSLLELPKILYYGKLDGFKKDEIANRLNRHGWVKGDVQINPNTIVTIERNLSPQDLTVYKYNSGQEPSEDNNIGKAGVKNYQDYIDIEVTGLPYHIFSNIISLSVNDFKSFISMTPHDKRVIIDKLFTMEIINKMNWLVKTDLRNIKIDIDLYDKEIASLQGSIKNAKSELEKLKQKINEDSTKRVELISKKLIDYKKKYDIAKSKLKQYEDKYEDIKKSYNIFIQQKSDINGELRQLKHKIDLYNKDKCPTCETSFEAKQYEILKGNLEESEIKKKRELENILEHEKKYNLAFLKVKEGINTINNYIIQVKSTYNSYKKELEKLKEDSPKEYKSIQSIISNNTKNIQKREKEKETYDKKYKYLTILEELYSDAGIKKKILESYLPTLNKEIEYTLTELHFPYRLSFNNNFEPNIEHLGIPINVETLSTGEKKRVDLAVLISIIRMLKRKYPNLNIFMLDEVLSSVDSDGIYDILGLLQKTAHEMMINIFVINHAPLPIDYFKYKIDVYKRDGFSDLIIEKLNEED